MGIGPRLPSLLFFATYLFTSDFVRKIETQALLRSPPLRLPRGGADSFQHEPAQVQGVKRRNKLSQYRGSPQNDW